MTGIDVAETAIASARAVAQQRGITAKLFVANATTWRPEGQYDLIASSFSLPETSEGRASVYRMVRDALAPGGTVLIKDFDSTMNRVRFFVGMELVTIEELVDAFAAYNVVREEIVDTPVHHHGSGDAHQEERWTAALFQARRGMD